MSTDPALSPATGLDYEAEEYFHVETPQQLKALGSSLRLAILSLLNERAASVTELADSLQRPKGTVGYHVKVLEDTGFIHVVRSRKVRAMTEKFYGRVAHTVIYHGLPDSHDPMFMVQQALTEVVTDRDLATPAFTLRHVRMIEEQAVEFWEQVVQLAEAFTKAPRGGDRVYGFLGGIYPTDLPTLPDDEEKT